MAEQWTDDIVPLLKNFEELLDEKHYNKLRYLVSHLVDAGLSQNNIICTYVAYQAMRAWGFNWLRVVPALRIERALESAEKGVTVFQREFLPEEGKPRAELVFVVLHPCLVPESPEDASKKVVVPAVTDLYMTPELDAPFYLMGVRGSLTPLVMYPKIKAFEYILLDQAQDPTTHALVRTMTPEQRVQLERMREMAGAKHPLRNFVERSPEGLRRTVEHMLRIFTEGDDPRPTQAFFERFRAAMERFKALGEYDPETRTLKIGKQ